MSIKKTIYNLTENNQKYVVESVVVSPPHAAIDNTIAPDKTSAIMPVHVYGNVFKTDFSFCPKKLRIYK